MLGLDGILLVTFFLNFFRTKISCE